jgi:hypothetical protein
MSLDGRIGPTGTDRAAAAAPDADNGNGVPPKKAVRPAGGILAAQREVTRALKAVDKPHPSAGDINRFNSALGRLERAEMTVYGEAAGFEKAGQYVISKPVTFTKTVNTVIDRHNESRVVRDLSHSSAEINFVADEAGEVTVDEMSDAVKGAVKYVVGSSPNAQNGTDENKVRVAQIARLTHLVGRSDLRLSDEQYEQLMDNCISKIMGGNEPFSWNNMSFLIGILDGMGVNDPRISDWIGEKQTQWWENHPNQTLV